MPQILTESQILRSECIQQRLITSFIFCQDLIRGTKEESCVKLNNLAYSYLICILMINTKDGRKEADFILL